MTYRYAPMLVLILGTASIGCGQAEVDGQKISMVTCRFNDGDEVVRDGKSSFEIKGTPEHPKFIVRFNNYSGYARLERNDQPWPETLDLTISGPRDTILFLSLIPEGFGEINLGLIMNRNWVLGELSRPPGQMA